MAAKEKETQNYWKEKVPFMAFKDGNKYKEDIFVAINGKSYQIKRGELVYIPRNVAEVLNQSMKQDTETNEMMNALEKEFLNKKL